MSDRLKIHVKETPRELRILLKHASIMMQPRVRMLIAIHRAGQRHLKAPANGANRSMQPEHPQLAYSIPERRDSSLAVQRPERKIRKTIGLL